MDEAEFWTGKLRPKLIKLCQEAGLRNHFERVENMVADGTPDVIYCIGGAEGGIELKYAPTHPARDTSQVLSKGKGLRRSQVIYATRRAWAGGRVFCMVGTPAEAWLIDLCTLAPPAMVGIATASVMELRALSVWYSVAHPWEMLIPVLRGTR